MKKTSFWLTLFLALALVLAFASPAWAGSAADCPGACAHTAAIGTTHYDTLREAVADVSDNGTVTLLASMPRGTTDGFDCGTKIGVTFSIDRTASKYTLRGDTGDATSAEGAFAQWLAPPTHICTTNGNIYTYTPNTAVYTVARYGPVSGEAGTAAQTAAPTSIPDNAMVYYYTTLAAALEAASTGFYHNAIALLADNTETVDLAIGPGGNRTVNIIDNGFSFTGSIAKNNYVIEQSVPAAGVTTYLFRSITATLTMGGNTVNIFGGYPNALNEANTLAAQTEERCTFQYTSNSMTLQNVTNTLAANIDWVIPTGKKLTFFGAGVLTVEGSLDVQGSMQFAANTVLKIKGDVTLDSANLLLSSSAVGKQIIRDYIGGYTVYSVVFDGTDKAASYQLPGGTAWIPCQELSEAVDMVRDTGGRVRLEKDCGPVSIVGFTLDLNGFTMSAPNSVHFGENAVIMDSSPEQTGVIDGIYSESYPALRPLSGQASLTIESGSIYSEKGIAILLETNGDDTASVVIGSKASVWGGQYGILIQTDDENYADVTLDISGAVSGGHGGVYVNGQVQPAADNASSITIRDGAVIGSPEGTNNLGIYAAGYAEWNISGGAFYGQGSAAGIKSGIFNISGGDFICLGPDNTPAPGSNSGMVNSGAAIQIEKNNAYPGDIVLHISGGTFTSVNGYAYYEYDSDSSQPLAPKTLMISSAAALTGHENVGDVNINDYLILELSGGAVDLTYEEGDGDDYILPTPVKGEFAFAGWYGEDGLMYDAGAAVGSGKYVAVWTDPSLGAGISVTPVKEEGKLTADIPAEQLAAANVSGGEPGPVTVLVETLEDADEVEVQFPAKQLKDLAKNGAVDGLTLDTPGGILDFDDAALDALTAGIPDGAADIKVVVATKRLDAADLGQVENASPTAIEEAREIIEGGGIVLDLNAFLLNNGGEKNTVSNFGGGLVTISIPYVLGDQDPRGLAVFYISDAGDLEQVPASYSNGVISFQVGHFSLYGVDYDPDRLVEPSGNTFADRSSLNGSPATPGSSAPNTTPKPDATAPWVSPYSDVRAGDWYFDHVKELTLDGVINGYPDGTFRPMAMVTWGEGLKMVMMAAGYAAQPALTGGHWASGFAAQALADGLIDAVPADLNAPMDRMAIATVSARALKLSLSEEATPFADADNGELTALFEAKIVTGDFNAAGERQYRPADLITRGELCAIVCRVNSYGK